MTLRDRTALRAELVISMRGVSLALFGPVLRFLLLWSQSQSRVRFLSLSISGSFSFSGFCCFSSANKDENFTCLEFRVRLKFTLGVSSVLDIIIGDDPSRARHVSVLSKNLCVQCHFRTLCVYYGFLFLLKLGCEKQRRLEANHKAYVRPLTQILPQIMTVKMKENNKLKN